MVIQWVSATVKDNNDISAAWLLTHSVWLTASVESSVDFVGARAKLLSCETPEILMSLLLQQSSLCYINMFEGWVLGHQSGFKSSGSHANVITPQFTGFMIKRHRLWRRRISAYGAKTSRNSPEIRR